MLDTLAFVVGTVVVVDAVEAVVGEESFAGAESFEPEPQAAAPRRMQALRTSAADTDRITRG